MQVMAPNQFGSTGPLGSKNGAIGGAASDPVHYHNFIRADERGSITQIDHPRDGSEMLMMENGSH